MREEEEEEEEEEGGKWFSRWEEQLPSPEELMPLSQTLITPDLALAFDIPTTTTTTAAAAASAADFDSADPNGGVDEPARTLKRPRLVWTPQLHKRFVDAVAHLGIKSAVPKTIMQLMSVEGLTRENVASHLQKYRLYLKRMQQQQQQQQGGLTSSSSAGSPADAATDQLFATAPIPHHFLRGGGGGAGGGPAPPPDPPFMPFVPVAALHHQQQMVQQYHQRQMGHFGSAAMGMGVGFDHGGFINRGQPPQPGMHHRMGPPVPADSEGGGRGGGGRRMLTLFPTGED